MINFGELTGTASYSQPSMNGSCCEVIFFFWGSGEGVSFNSRMSILCHLITLFFWPQPCIVTLSKRLNSVSWLWFHGTFSRPKKSMKTQVNHPDALQNLMMIKSVTTLISGRPRPNAPPCLGCRYVSGSWAFFYSYVAVAASWLEGWALDELFASLFWKKNPTISPETEVA